MSSGVERRVVYRTFRFREYLLLWEIPIFPPACRISAEALCVSELAAAPESWQLLLLFAIYGRLFALMLPNDRVEAGAGSLFLETVSHNKTVSYDKTFQASSAAEWSECPEPRAPLLRCLLLCLGPVPGTQSNRLHRAGHNNYQQHFVVVPWLADCLLCSFLPMSKGFSMCE